MTVHTLPASPKGDDIDDFLAELDRDLKPSKGSATKPAAKKAPAEDVFVQQWFPNGVEFVLNTQTCACCNEKMQTVEGLYMIDLHRNGAIRKTRHSGGKLPIDYRYYKPSYSELETSIESCPWCYKPETPPEPVAPTLDRPLTAEDQALLRELDKELENAQSSK